MSSIQQKMINHVKKQKIMTLNQKKIETELEIKAMIELVDKFGNKTIIVFMYRKVEENITIIRKKWT